MILFGLIGLILNLVALGVTMLFQAYTIARVLILTYILVFSSGLGPALYIYISTSLPAGCVLCDILCMERTWFLCNFTLLYIKASPIGASGAFFIYAGGCLISLIHLSMELPETRNKTFKEVMAFYNIHYDTIVVTVDLEASKTLLEIVALREMPGVIADRLKESVIIEEEYAENLSKWW